MIASLCRGLTAALLLSGIVVAKDESQSDKLGGWQAAHARTSGDAMALCPPPCQESSSSDPSKAPFLFSNAVDLAACNETMILDVAVQNAAEDGTRGPMTIKACRAEFTTKFDAYVQDEDVAAICPTPNHEITKASVSMGRLSSSGDKKFDTADLLAGGKQLLNSFGAKEPSCTENFLSFAYSQSSVIGLFGGSELHQHGVPAEVLNKFLKHAQESSVSETTVVQLCKQGRRGSDYAVGIIATSADHLDLAQDAVKSWADGRCVSADGNANSDWTTVSIRVPGTGGSSNSTSPPKENFDSENAAHMWGKSRIAVRADTCKTTTVKENDGCWALAERCDISESDLKKFNPQSNFCSTLVVGQKVCCSKGDLPDLIPPANPDGTCKTVKVVSGDGCESLAGKCDLKPADFTKLHSGDKDFCSKLVVGQAVCCTRGKLPDIKPQPGADGSCAKYTIKNDDGCAAIAAAHGLKQSDIMEFNKKTWGWTGCDPLMPGIICLSKGTPPFPTPVGNAQCGPTVPDTEKPKDSTSDEWAKLNPCPLNVCCNVWGKCGFTDDFCIESKSETGAPGTSKEKNGCEYLKHTASPTYLEDPIIKH